ncbi:hypothetical protein CSOJ01_07929 [Colletotrichum sojae]|uniref:Uncharacterized protein n=1 Tax=Colletotrichum sojae TaxID=2175907 RepID=A0A8H6J797_9PEZI|nr:hypothetical protein CSOJ01_07929 [Colletotrichum sojae]
MAATTTTRKGKSRAASIITRAGTTRSRHWVLGTGHWALGTGHWALGTGHWALGTGQAENVGNLQGKAGTPHEHRWTIQAGMSWTITIRRNRRHRH